MITKTKVMGERFDRATGFVRDVVEVIRGENVTFLAGSIAYNAFVSLLPLLLLTVVAIAVVGSPALESMVVDAATAIAPSLQGLIQNLLTGEAAGVSVVGTLTLLWGSLKLFRGLDTAFSEVYGAEDENGLVDQVTDGLVVLVAIATAIAVTVLATLALSVLSFVPFIRYLDSAILLVGLVLAFLPMYYVFPDVDVTVREILPGVVVAAVGWTILQGLFQVYLALAGRGGGGEVGVFTGVLVLITWLYFSGLVLLVGVAVNAVRGEHAEPVLVAEFDPDDDIDAETAAAYLETLGEAFASPEREEVSDVSVADPDDIELEQDEFVFGPDGRESAQQVRVRWTDRRGGSDPADD
jgi:membrane protein